ncbi:hypothetical protein C8Q77DRAFT_1036418, partial [Trametes polyzona]
PLVPQCNVCYGWGHVRRNCRARNPVCARCGGPHKASAHNHLAACCRERPDRDTAPCACPPRCRNCNGAHYAHDRACEFARHRSNWDWYRSRVPSLA